MDTEGGYLPAEDVEPLLEDPIFVSEAICVYGWRNG